VGKFAARPREVFLLVIFQGLKYQETADALGIPLGSVRSRLRKAILRLRRAFL
jgi:RNA polymerase sigma factor (sigma-70 family)